MANARLVMEQREQIGAVELGSVCCEKMMMPKGDGTEATKGA
jgi:hypothetical protein